MAEKVRDDWFGNPDKNLGDFRGGRRGELNAARRRDQNRNRNQGKAQRDLRRQAGNLFDRNGNIKRSARIDDIAKFAETADYLGFKGVDEGTVDKLRDARDKLKDRLFNKDGSLKNPSDKNSHDMNQYRRLDTALQGKDAADEADRIAKEKKENDAKRQKLEEDRTEKLKTIDGRIEKILEKMGM